MRASAIASRMSHGRTRSFPYHRGHNRTGRAGGMTQRVGGLLGGAHPSHAATKSPNRAGATPMSGSQNKTALGRIFPICDAWLAKAPPEPIVDPDLPIIDTHHHLWQRQAGGARGESWEVPEFRYLLNEFLADCATGHNIVGSGFLPCLSEYRKGGPAQMRPVGETEFVAGIAAMSDSGGYGKTRVCAGIVGYADLTSGDWGTPVLGAHTRAGGGR